VGALSGETVLQDAHGKEDACQKVKDAVFCTRTDQAGKLLGKLNGAGDRDRTGDIQLGKLAFYR
jgi:hypothetical protein